MFKVADLTSTYRANLIIDSYKGWIKEKQTILDIGCGTGVVAEKISKKFSCLVTGCDVQKYLIRKIPFVKMEYSDKLPFKNQSFKLSMFNDVLHHTSYENQKRLIFEALRVSETLLIFELKPTLLGKISDYLINKIHNPKMEIPYTYRSPKEWSNLFLNMHLRIRSKNVTKPVFYPFSHIAFLVSSE